MFELYKKLKERYPNWRFGYVEEAEFVQLSVVNAQHPVRHKFVKLDPNLPLQDYANAWTNLLRDLLPQKDTH